MNIIKPTIAAVATALILAPAAHADANQDAYVNELHAWNIGRNNPADLLVKNGYLSCTLLANNDVISAANKAAPSLGLSVGDAALQIGAAIRWLCPQQTWQINELRSRADPRVPGVSSAITGYLS